MDKNLYLHLGGEKFLAVEEIPIGALLELASVEEGDPNSLREFRHFLFSVIEEEEEPRLKKLLRRKPKKVYVTDDNGEFILDGHGEKILDRIVPAVTMEDIDKALNRLQREMAARPTKSSASSSAGSKSTKPKSRDDSPSPATEQPAPESAPQASAPPQRRVVNLQQRTVRLVDGPPSDPTEPSTQDSASSTA